MLKSIQSKNPKISSQEITEFEKRWNIRIPASCRQFLLRHNGGRPFPPAFPITGMQNNPKGEIQVFFGLRAEHNSHDLDWVLENLGVPQPDGLLPIARTSSGDYVCLSTKSGRIIFWDRMACWGKANWSAADFYPIAESFDQFLASLHEVAELDEPEIDRIIRTNDVEGLKRVLAGGYDTEILDKNGRTAIERAAIAGKPDLIRVLHQNGAKLKNALELAKSNYKFFPKHKETVELLEQLQV